MVRTKVTARKPNTERLYQVEDILSERATRHGRRGPFYLVKWKGFDKSHNSWEPSSNLNQMAIVHWWEKKHTAKAKKEAEKNGSMDTCEANPYSDYSDEVEIVAEKCPEITIE
ncbi:hypothetical protein HDE_07672 [Halotydeus destructor]|nr:hypothetical protein HDE_07672 [Halotydeus destructor]